MNGIDLTVCLVLLLALYNGWKRGLILQICSLAGIVAGIYLASRYGAMVGGWLHLDVDIAVAGGFATVLILTIIVVAIGAYALRKVFHFAGFGILDTLLGIVVAEAKYLLVLSVLFAAFSNINRDHTLLSAKTIAESRLYGPILHISEMAKPLCSWAERQLPQSDKQQ